MIWPFWRKGVISLGIDIGTSSIKVVQLEKKGNTIRLVTYGDLLRTNEENTDQAS